MSLVCVNCGRSKIGDRTPYIRGGEVSDSWLTKPTLWYPQIHQFILVSQRSTRKTEPGIPSPSTNCCSAPFFILGQILHSCVWKRFSGGRGAVGNGRFGGAYRQADGREEKQR